MDGQTEHFNWSLVRLHTSTTKSFILKDAIAACITADTLYRRTAPTCVCVCVCVEQHGMCTGDDKLGDAISHQMHSSKYK